jgi:hypothetical protein
MTHPYVRDVELQDVQFRAGGACPDCAGTLFNPGPRGGGARNVRCARCGAKFWYAPPFTPKRLEESEDQFYRLDVALPLSQL